AFAERKYAALKRAVEDAGFFAPQVIGEHDGDHIVCTSKYRRRHCAERHHASGHLFTTRFATRASLATRYAWLRIIDRQGRKGRRTVPSGALPLSKARPLTMSPRIPVLRCRT